MSKKILPFESVSDFSKGGAMAQLHPPLNMLLTTYKKIAKNNRNKHLMKHNHDKRYTCCPLKMLCPGILLNLDLDIGKQLKNKNKLSSY